MLRPILVLLLGMLFPAAAGAATYHGNSVDGPRFNARIVNEDFGAFPSVEVKFWGRSATVFLRGRSQLNLILDDEEIVDPHHIPAHDDLRGLEWEIDVRSLRESSDDHHS